MNVAESKTAVLISRQARVVFPVVYAKTHTTVAITEEQTFPAAANISSADLIASAAFRELNSSSEEDESFAFYHCGVKFLRY